MFLQLHNPLWLRISSQFQGSSKWCMITFVAKFLAALHAFITAACSVAVHRVSPLIPVASFHQLALTMFQF
ncbi:BnaC03g30120D [Brassica napus]|uniref:BnaC03g30120D protein n=1 Tax=Brassica napus TaxID=3708 RepID=A0A078G9A8_BRANA|nr:BnaC03g30120D [Brassica napus]